MFQISKFNPWQGEGPEQVVVTLVYDSLLSKNFEA